MNRHLEALRQASSEEERIKAVREMRDACEKHEPVSEAIPALLEVMMAGREDVLVSGTFILEHAAAFGYDLTPAVPALVRGLFFTFRHHAARVLINYVNHDRTRVPRVMEAIRTSGMKGTNRDLDRVVSACTEAVPVKEWRWGKCGVDTFSGCLTWFNEATGRNYSEQTYDEFRKKGPWAPSSIMKEHEVPEEVWQELHRIFGVKATPRRTKEKIEAEVEETVSKLEAAIKPLPVEACSICSTLPEQLDDLPFAKLRHALEFNQGGEDFWQCTVCGRLYAYEHEVDNEVGASFVADRYWRTTPGEIRARLRERALKFEWTWRVR